MKNLFLVAVALFVSNFVYSQSVKATTTKGKNYRETTVSLELNADEAKVWSLLTNTSDFTRWNSTVTSLEGKIALGEKIKLKSTLDSKRTFNLEVKEIEINKKLVWGDKKGNRTYTISKLDHGKVLFTMTEKIGGFMFNMYANKIPSFDESFEIFASDLKKEAEKK